MKKRYLDSIKKLDKFIALFLVDIDNYQETNVNLVKYFTNIKHFPGVYITINKPFSTLADTFKRNGVDTNMIIFIDAVSHMHQSHIPDAENCFYLRSPRDLSDISIAMTEAVRAISQDEKFVFFDSLNTLLVYSSQETVARFMHFLAGKMRNYQVDGIIICLRKDTDPGLISEVSQFCDATITV